MSLNWLLLLIPVALGLNWFGFSPILVFAASALSIMPLAELMGRATEALPAAWERPSAACSTPP